MRAEDLKALETDFEELADVFPEQTKLERARVVVPDVVDEQLRAEFSLPSLDDRELAEAEARARADLYLFAYRRLKEEVDVAGQELKLVVARLQDRHARLVQHASERLRWLSLMLESIARRYTPKDKRSLTLVAGRIGYRKTAARLLVEDEPATLAWIDEQLAGVAEAAALVRIRRAVDIRELTAFLRERGVIDAACVVQAPGLMPAGLQRIEERDDFYVTPEEG